MRGAALLFLLTAACGSPPRAPPPSLEVNPKPATPRSLSGLDFLEQYARTRRFTLGQPQAITLTPRGDAVLFLRSGPRSPVQDLYQWASGKGAEGAAEGKRRRGEGEERVLLEAERILGGKEEELSAEERARRERMRLTARGVASYSLSEDGRRILVPLGGLCFVYERSSGELKELPSGAGGHPVDPRFSPDGSRVACVRDGDLYVTDLELGPERRLTTRRGPTVTNGLAEFVAQEEMDRMQGYWWSPDGGTIACQETDTGGVEVFRIADPARPESEPQAWTYPRAGKRNAEVKLRLLPVGEGQEVWVEWDRGKYPYLATVTWTQRAPLTILVQNREQTEEALLEVDPRDGSTKTLLIESDSAWLNLYQSAPRWLSDGSGFFWITERRGAAQLELRKRDGTLEEEVSSTDFALCDLVTVDVRGRWAYVLAARDPGGRNDPTVRHLWRLPVRNPRGEAPRGEASRGEAQCLTAVRGQHSAVFAREASVAVVISQTFDGEVSWNVKREEEDGRWVEAGRLRSSAETLPFLPQVELTVAGGQYWASVVKPRDFVPWRNYPVLVSVYGGPKAQTVTASRRAYLLQQWFADQGFLVVSLDGRGTPNRGREWERAIKGNLIELVLLDQVEGLKALFMSYPAMDPSRVGIYGWSFGGYVSLMAAMRRPEVYRAAVAGAPVVEWLDYDTHYTERYLGLPQKNPQGYRLSSALTHAGTLSRPLLILHGTADDNVYFFHALKLIGELFKAEKGFEFVPLPGHTHMVADPEAALALNARIARFFLEHLGGPQEI